MKTLFSISLIIVSLSAFSQLFGPQQVITPQTHHPVSIHPADLDGDGDIDVLSASVIDNKIAWFENDNGEFTLPHVIDAESPSASAVFAADFDGDGDLDVLGGGRENKLAWYENDGQASFTEEHVLQNYLSWINSVFASDLDGDGDMDILAASQNNSKIVWYANDGLGNFSDEHLLNSAATWAMDVEAADLDGDGDMDVISASRFPDKIAWYENQGNGIFSSEILIDAGADHASSAIATDIDGDGDLDVVSTSAFGGLRWNENDGDGNFSNWITIGYWGWPDGVEQASAFDFNEDGHVDIVCASKGDDEIEWYANNGDGTFSSAIVIDDNTGTPQDVCLADINGDGHMDVLSASLEEDKIVWYANDGLGNFETGIMLCSNVRQAKEVAALDFDGDGDLDVVSSANHSRLALYENNGNGTFSKEIPLGQNEFGASSFGVSDLDGDGDEDLLYSFSGEGQIGWFENAGEGDFSSEHVITTTANSVFDVITSDLDGDGDMDVVSALRNAGKILWFENLGEGVFSTENIISSDAISVNSIFVADLDGDGDIDVLSVERGYDEIVWYENNGSTVFSDGYVISTNVDGVSSVFASDLDGDGDIDVLSSSEDDNKIAWYENLGEGMFATQIIISSIAETAESVHAADLDGDGDMDVLSAARGDGKIVWYENDGNANFLNHITIEPESVFGSYASTADLDGDGDLDVVACVHGDKISWYENTLGNGCTDTEAQNYNPDAWIEDGSCCYVQGCTNALALNFDEEACLDNGECNYNISGIVFNDEDNNGLFDENEAGLAFQTITLDPLGITLITNNAGEFSFQAEGSQNLLFSAVPSLVFPYNTTLNPFTFAPETASSTHIEIGLSTDVLAFEVDVNLYPFGNSFLCDTWMDYVLGFRNDGNVPIDGIVELEHDSLFQDYLEVTAIDSVIGNNVYMSFENLQPGQMFLYNVDLLTPPVEYIGDTVTNYARVYGFYDGDQVASGEYSLTMEIACAYDPNDKQAFPLGYTDEHWLLQETEQEFLIRFQNTGNAPAQNIRIQDTLDVNFDIESFKLMANSHSVMTTIDPETRLIDFYFEDIQLPDSVNDEPNSHGLISYKITPLPNLPVGSVLENTAYIYFDNNEPIITNTTWTTIHECGGEADFSVSFLTVCDAAEVQLSSSYPHLTALEWVIEDETIVNESIVGFSVQELADYEVILTAENPLCSETTSQVVQVTELGPEETCMGDFNCDELRDTNDLLSLLSVFGEEGLYREDLDGNQMVNVIDVISFLALHNSNCGG